MISTHELSISSLSIWTLEFLIRLKIHARRKDQVGKKMLNDVQTIPPI
jgi:hypothetical protein